MNLLDVTRTNRELRKVIAQVYREMLAEKIATELMESVGNGEVPGLERQSTVPGINTLEMFILERIDGLQNDRLIEEAILAMMQRLGEGIEV